MPRRDFSASPLERQFIFLRVGQTNSLQEMNAITQSNVGADTQVRPYVVVAMFIQRPLVYPVI